jgi:hypothetical protein
MFEWSKEMPPLYLHIGRSKSGSSTIQGLLSGYPEWMESASIYCPMTLQGKANHTPLAWALHDPKEKDRGSIDRFCRDLKHCRRRKVFVSSESLFNLPAEGILERLAPLVRRLEVKILFYVRDYPGWLPSLYVEHTKRAIKAPDFDSYFGFQRKNVSVLPRLEQWAAVFGWDALRVRPLDARALVGGNLISDLLHALGVEGSPPDVPPLNVSPHWITVESQRALAIAAASAGIGILDRRSRKQTRHFFERCAAPEPSRTQYVTLAQWHDLAALYRADMEEIGRRTGTPFPISLEEPGERSFLPSFAAVPDGIKSRIRAEMHTLGRDVIPLVERMLDDKDIGHLPADEQCDHSSFGAQTDPVLPADEDIDVALAASSRQTSPALRFGQWWLRLRASFERRQK